MTTADSSDRTPEQLEADAKQRVQDVNVKDVTEQTPDPNASKQPSEVDQKIIAQKAEEQKTEQAIEESGIFLKCALFWITFGFGTLTILAVGAIIFYLLDYAASVFDFDLSDYTAYICLVLTLANMLMSCVGCFGTFKFSEVKKNSNKELDKVLKDLQKVGQDLETDNEQLKMGLRKFEVELQHMDGENRELEQTLQSWESKEEELKGALKQESKVLVSLSELWKLWQIQETNDIIFKIVKITAEYYNTVYQDNDTEDGLNEEQYNTLMRIVIPRKYKQYFPDFNHSVWKRNRKGAPLLVDELERVCVLVYKGILEKSLQIDIAQVDQGKNEVALEVAREVLQRNDENNEEDGGGFFSFFRNDD